MLGSEFGMSVRYLLVRGGVEVVEVVVVSLGLEVLILVLVMMWVLFLWVRERPGVVWVDMVSGMIVILLQWRSISYDQTGCIL